MRSPSRAEATRAGLDDAVQAALRLLRHRDRSTAQVDRELAARGIREDVRSEVLATLERTGIVDDSRFAERRAAALADRCAGDALIAHDLTAAGVAADVVHHAVSALEEERDRARRIADRRGASPKTARYLAAKGFSDEVVRAVVARAGDEGIG